jgi:hypothetical protein
VVYINNNIYSVIRRFNNTCQHSTNWFAMVVIRRFSSPKLLLFRKALTPLKRLRPISAHLRKEAFALRFTQPLRRSLTPLFVKLQKLNSPTVLKQFATFPVSATTFRSTP